MADMTPWQKTILQTYGDGDYAHYADLSQEELDELLDKDPKVFGDTLLVFLLLETSPKEDCHNQETAHYRVQRALEDVLGVSWALANEANQIEVITI